MKRVQIVSTVDDVIQVDVQLDTEADVHDFVVNQAVFYTMPVTVLVDGKQFHYCIDCKVFGHEAGTEKCPFETSD